MKILSRALFLFFILVGVLIAVSNAQPVTLALWPMPHVLVMPLKRQTSVVGEFEGFAIHNASNPKESQGKAGTIETLPPAIR